MNKEKLLELDKEVLVSIIKSLETMNDLQAQYEPLNTEDGYVEKEDAEAYDEASDDLGKIAIEYKLYE